MARNCRTCQHSIFDERWGEWKCKRLEIIVEPAKYNKCGGYVKDKEKTREKRTP